MTTRDTEQVVPKSNKEELDSLHSEELITDVMEGFAEIDRGDYVVVTQDELLEKIRDAQTHSG